MGGGGVGAGMGGIIDLSCSIICASSSEDIVWVFTTSPI
jgi:hypothetical protein